MGFRTPSGIGALVLNSTGTGGETQLLVLGPLTPISDGQAIFLLFRAVYVSTATTLNVRMLIRRGSGVAGTLVATLTDLVSTAGQTVERIGIFADITGSTGPQQYSLNCSNITGGAATVFAELSFIAFTL